MHIVGASVHLKLHGIGRYQLNSKVPPDLPEIEVLAEVGTLA